ncbi:MAG: protein-glutamate O-methyltransferase CheR [Myxococcota bacterium]
MTMSDAQFAHVTTVLRSKLGIHIEADKRPMLTARFRHMVRNAGCTSFEQYFNRFLAQPNKSTLSMLADKLSTNHTFFWREAAHFEAFRDVVLPEARTRHEKDHDIRIWCAAASMGQEPYTLVMLMRELFGPAYGSWQLGVLATDISDRALTIARKGEYDADDVERLPAAMRAKYMQPQGKGRFQVRADIRDQVTYRRLNLVNDKWLFKGRFDCVFLRNVLIYFNLETKRALLERMAMYMVPNGVIFVGITETLRTFAPQFQMVQPGMYRKVNS